MEEPMKDTKGQEILVTPMPPSDPLKSRDRITANLITVFEHSGSSAESCDPRFSDFVETFDLEPYKKRLKASPDWQPLKFGDLEKEQVGMIVVQNLAGCNLQTLPTEEEKEKYAKQVILVRKSGDNDGLYLKVRPSRFNFFELECSPLDLEFKCTHESCN